MNTETFGAVATELAYFTPRDPAEWAPVRHGLYLCLCNRLLGFVRGADHDKRVMVGLHLLAACEREGVVELREVDEGLEFRRRDRAQYTAPRTTVLAPLVRGEDR